MVGQCPGGWRRRWWWRRYLLQSIWPGHDVLYPDEDNHHWRGSHAAECLSFLGQVYLQRLPDYRDLVCFPGRFRLFQKALCGKMHRALFVVILPRLIA